MAYSDYLAVNDPNYKAPAATPPSTNNEMHNPLADWAQSAFGKAPDVHAPGMDYSTTLYGGNVYASQANLRMLEGMGDSGLADDQKLGQTLYNSSLNTGKGVFQQGMDAATGSKVAGGQASAQGQQIAGSGVGTQQQAVSNIGNWLNQGPGPSVAEAQLRQGNDQNVANMMAMAASGRGQGGGAAAQQAAAFQAANAGQQTNQEAAVLRAQEAQAWKQSQLAGINAQAGIGANLTGAGQNAQNLGLNYQQLAANQQQNAGSQLLSAQQNAGGQALNAQNLGQQDRQFYYNLGQNQLANQSQAATGLQENWMNAETQAQTANQQSFYQHQSGIGGMIGAAAGALALSDKRAKENIEKDENPLDFLESYKFSYKDSAAHALASNAAREAYERVFADAKEPRRGVMAQDLGKSREGRETLASTPEGLAIDSNRALSFLLSNQAKLNQRLNSLENG